MRINSEIVCPYCNGYVECEYVDIGVGLQQSTPYQCVECQSAQMYSDSSEKKKYSEAERWFGWVLHPSYPDRDVPNRLMSEILERQRLAQKKINRNRLERVE